MVKCLVHGTAMGGKYGSCVDGGYSPPSHEILLLCVCRELEGRSRA